MSDVKLIVTCAVAAVVMGGLDAALGWFPGWGMSWRRRLGVEWASSFLFLLLADLLLMLWGEPLGWVDVGVCSVGVCSVGVGVDGLFLWIKSLRRP